MQVAVLGLGYIGLPTAGMLAEAGHEVIGVDVNPDVVASVANGCNHLTELDIRDLVRAALASGNLTLSTALPSFADAWIICVPTPTKEHRPDLSYVEAAASAIAPLARNGDLVILESTVPPGTVGNVIARAIAAAGKNPDDLCLAHCPERVIPGSIVRELRENARVIGGRRPGDAEAAASLYKAFCTGNIFITDAVTAEVVKVVENTFRDVNLAFANELALLSEELGVDAWEVIRLANNHPRVNVLRPGPGVGGHCIPVDPHFLSNANPFVTELIQTARRVNERMPHVVARMIEEIAPARNRPTVAILGASYKADVADTRESPTLALVSLLEERRYNVRVYDPLASDFERPLAESLEAAVSGADAIVLLTDHAAFREIDPNAIADRVATRTLLDTRNFLDGERWRKAGFTVRVLGRSNVDPVVEPLFA